MVTRTQVLEKIKDDGTKIYGQSIFDVFLQTVEFIDINHLLNFSEKEKDLLSQSCIYNLLNFVDHYRDYSEEEKKKSWMR